MLQLAGGTYDRRKEETLVKLSCIDNSDIGSMRNIVCIQKGSDATFLPERVIFEFSPLIRSFEW